MTKCTKQKERSYNMSHNIEIREFKFIWIKCQLKSVNSELKKAEEALAKFNNDPNAAALSILTSGL